MRAFSTCCVTYPTFLQLQPGPTWDLHVGGGKKFTNFDDVRKAGLLEPSSNFMTFISIDHPGPSIINGVDFNHFSTIPKMAMDQYLYIPFLGGWTSINPSYLAAILMWTTGVLLVLTHCQMVSRFTPLALPQKRHRRSFSNSRFTAPQRGGDRTTDGRRGGHVTWAWAWCLLVYWDHYNPIIITIIYYNSIVWYIELLNSLFFMDWCDSLIFYWSTAFS